MRPLASRPAHTSHHHITLDDSARSNSELFKLDKSFSVLTVTAAAASPDAALTNGFAANVTTCASKQLPLALSAAIVTSPSCMPAAGDDVTALMTDDMFSGSCKQ